MKVLSIDDERRKQESLIPDDVYGRSIISRNVTKYDYTIERKFENDATPTKKLYSIPPASSSKATNKSTIWCFVEGVANMDEQRSDVEMKEEVDVSVEGCVSFYFGGCGEEKEEEEGTSSVTPFIDSPMSLSPSSRTHGISCSPSSPEKYECEGIQPSLIENNSPTSILTEAHNFLTEGCCLYYNIDCGEAEPIKYITGPRIITESDDAIGNDLTRFQPILTKSAFYSLIANALPTALTQNNWIRIFSLVEHGDSIETMLHRVKNYDQTILVIESTNREVFGGFVDSPWEIGDREIFDVKSGNSDDIYAESLSKNDQEKKSGRRFESPRRSRCHSFSKSSPHSPKRRSFYGSRQAFLFAVRKAMNTERSCSPAQLYDEVVDVYPWSGQNDLIQFCDVSNGGRLAMGGGGRGASFGLCIEDCFSKGSSGRCKTFCNKSLSSNENFDVLNFEVYGFSNGFLS